PIVRIQAGRLRHSLERYYLLSGRDDTLQIRLPKGTYVPTFSRDEAERPSPLPRGPAVRRESGDGWPFLAIAEFEAVGSDPELAELAFRTTEEIGLELGRYRTMRMLHRDRGHEAGHNGARFALSGRLRAMGADVRVTARLVDHATGEQL